jgi:hypothetical protein
MGHLSEEYVQVLVPVQHFAKKLCFCGKLLVPHPTSKPEDYPLSVVRDSVFSTYTSTLHLLPIDNGKGTKIRMTSLCYELHAVQLCTDYRTILVIFIRITVHDTNAP